MPFKQFTRPSKLRHFCILSAAENAPFIVHPSTMKSMLYFFSGGVRVVNSDADEHAAAVKAAKLIQEQFDYPHDVVDRMMASFFTDAITHGRKQYVEKVLPIAKKFWDSAGKDPKLQNSTPCLLELLRCDAAYPLSCFDRDHVYVPLYRVASFNPSTGDTFTTGNGFDPMAGIYHKNKGHVILNLSVRIDVVHKRKRFSILLALHNPTLLQILRRYHPTLRDIGRGNVYYFIGEVMKMMFDPFFYRHLKQLLSAILPPIGPLKDPLKGIHKWLHSFRDDGDIPNNLVVRVLDFNCKVPQHIVKRADTPQNGFILRNQFSLPHIDHHGIRRLFYRSTDGTIWVLKIQNQFRLSNLMVTDQTSDNPTVLHVPPDYMDLPTDDKYQNEFLQYARGYSWNSMSFSMEQMATQSSLTLTQVINEKPDDKFKLDVGDVPREPGILPAGGEAAVRDPAVTHEFVDSVLKDFEKNNSKHSDPTWRNSFVSKIQGAFRSSSSFLSSAFSMASSALSMVSSLQGGRRALRRSLNKSKKKRGRTVRMYRRGLTYRKMTRRTRGRRRTNTRRSRKN
jgi:hypothetical protein